MKGPKPNTEYRSHLGRLALFHSNEVPKDYWKDYWEEDKCSSLSESGTIGELGLIEKYLPLIPKDLPILDAGCGPAHMVAALTKRNYKCIGVDYEKEVIQRARKVFPDLKLEVEDILSLSFPDGMFGCYLSGGIVEHFENGPLDALREARRVLHPKGVGLIEVPYLNPSREQMLQELNSKQEDQPNLFFHQYYFSVKEFQVLLEEAGFTMTEYMPDSMESFLISEHKQFSKFWKSKLCREKVKKPFRYLFPRLPFSLRKRFGHTIIFIAKPK